MAFPSVRHNINKQINKQINKLYIYIYIYIRADARDQLEAMDGVKIKSFGNKVGAKGASGRRSLTDWNSQVQ